MNYEKGFFNYRNAIEQDAVDILQKHYDAVDILQKHYDDGERFENKGIYIGAIPHARFFLNSFPLIEGIKHKSYNALKWLLDHGANVDLKTETTKKTPYQIAFESNDEKIWELFKIPRKNEKFKEQ